MAARRDAYMDMILKHGPRCGEVRAPVSKSCLHRLMICAALSRGGASIVCGELPRDAAATLRCLAALGAGYAYDGTRLRIDPVVGDAPGPAALPCGESASTLRFLLPLVGALGAEAEFRMEGRLPERPLEPFLSELAAHGISFERGAASLRCRGVLRAGEWSLPGNVSSQFISALLVSLPLLDGDSTLRVYGRTESSGYVEMTERALRLASVRFEGGEGLYRIPGGQRFALPAEVAAEGDWSGAAAFLAMGALSPDGVRVGGLEPGSVQPDRAVVSILRRFGAEARSNGGCVRTRRGELRGCVIDASQTPDLVPVLAALAALADGETRIINASRLRLKESDRLESSAAMLRALGADVSLAEDGLLIRGAPSLRGGVTDACSDHRVAMAAAVAACGCADDVVLRGAECVEKSFPRFWDELDSLGGCK